MLSRARNFVPPAYLFACLVLGGSAQGIWQNMVLQLAGLAIIAWAALAPTDESLTPAARQLLFIAIAALAVIALQLVPLPFSVWSHLGPRERLSDGFNLLGLKPSAEPLSLNPAGGLSSLLGVLPPLAIICCMLRLKAHRPLWLVIALIAGTTIGIALGALQVAGSSNEPPPWYLYEETNPGRGVGFFANADHMATLLLMAIPFLAALIAAAKKSGRQRYSAIVAIAAGVAILIVIGLLLNGSLAGYGLAPAVIAASTLVFLPSTGRVRGWILVLSVLFTVGCVAALETTAIGNSKIGEHATSAVGSRAEILATTSSAIRDFLPFGSGLGSFRQVYPLYESWTRVTSTFVIHAHNDYAEVVLELGVAGIILLLLFAAWWAIAVARVWRSAEAAPFARAASIASAAVLVHSLVDFPVRTAAIATCFGMCLALLADGRAAPPVESAQLRRTRHIEFR